MDLIVRCDYTEYNKILMYIFVVGIVILIQVLVRIFSSNSSCKTILYPSCGNNVIL